ncbi:MAG: CNNM domain-containing protein, partial [Nitrospirota bacterium]
MELAMLFPLMLILLFLKGFFSGSEIALVSADKIKLRSKAERGNKGAAMVLKLFERPEALLTTTLVGTNITTVALVTMGASLMIELLGDKGDFYAVLLLTPLLLILGEIVPKSVYQQKSNDLAPVIVYPLRVFSMVFSPVIFVFSRVARLAALLAGIKRPERTVFVIREQLRTMVEMAEAVPSVGVFDRVRIKHALRFSETTVGEAMTPLAEVVAIERGRSTRDALKLLRRRGFSRLPVYEGNITNIVGIVSFTAWDLSDGSLPEQPLKKHMRPALFVPA